MTFFIGQCTCMRRGHCFVCGIIPTGWFISVTWLHKMLVFTGKLKILSHETRGRWRLVRLKKNVFRHVFFSSPKWTPSREKNTHLMYLKVWWLHATLFTIYFSLYWYHTEQDRFTLHNFYMMRQSFRSRTGGIIFITSHSCDEARAGWDLA
jgi:hypothetical protein